MTTDDKGREVMTREAFIDSVRKLISSKSSTARMKAALGLLLKAPILNRIPSKTKVKK